MRYKAILFDMDGTLLDTLQDIAETVNSALRGFGFPVHEVNEYRYFVGDGEAKLAFRALPEDHRDPEMVNKVLSLFHQNYAVRWADNTRPYPGIPELLDYVAEQGIRMAILSNKRQKFVEEMATRLLSRWSFEVTLGADPSTPTKPDPAGALKVARQMGLEPGDFLYLGDSGVDMKTAVAAGMYPVGALWGYRDEDELLASGAKALVEEPSKLHSLLV
jgi:phosphoglycolate phosphatase